MEYLFDLNGTRAMLRATPGLKKESAAVQACRLLRRANVVQRIDQLIEERAQRVRVTADEVLARLWAIATADVRELVSVRIDPCPRCWQHHTKERPTPTERRLEQRRLRPNGSCGACGGGGQPRVAFADTRTMSEGARLLIAGVRRSSGGPEFELHDQLEALRLVGQHLRLWDGNAAEASEKPLMKSRSSEESAAPAGHDLAPSERPLDDALPRATLSDAVAERCTQSTPWRALILPTSGSNPKRSERRKS